MYLTRDDILKRATRQTADDESAVFGGKLRLRELSRIDYRAAAQGATIAGQTDNEIWWAAVFAAGVIDADGEPLFAIEDVLAFKQDAPLWSEIIRIVGRILHLSEVGADSLKSGDSPTDSRRRQGRGGRQRDQRSATESPGTAGADGG